MAKTIDQISVFVENKAGSLVDITRILGDANIDKPAAAPGNPNWAANYRSKSGEKPYRHKCTVCGRTDTQYPDLEFRYCSRCAGYHCYCIDHINNHVHITE